MKKIYIAGPMRGIYRFNFPAFDAARDSLRNEDVFGAWDVVSPADLDRAIGFDPWALDEDYDWNDLGAIGFSLSQAIDRDIAALRECDAIFMLNGWENSKGAKAELAYAEWKGLQVLYQNPPAMAELTTGDQGDVLLEAYDVTQGDRQASYGPPDQDFRRTAGMWTSIFSDMLKDGAAFKPFHVALAMIAIKISRQVHQRKRDNWVDMAGYARCGQLCDEAEA